MAATHHRCNLCGEDFPTRARLEEHVEKRHPKDDLHWWVVVEDPSEDLRFNRS